jgi:hypothetical protein
MADRGPLRISQFSGGINRLSPVKIAVNEAAVAENVLGTEGNLIVFPGRVSHAHGNLPAYLTSWAWAKYHERIYLNGQGYTVAWADGMLWLDTPQIPYWRPLWATDSLKNVCAYRNRLFISSNIQPYRWDGFYYITGTAACTGTTTVTGTNTNWSSGGVLPGDSLWLYYGAAWHKAAGAVTVGDILQVVSGTSLLLSAVGPNTGGTVPYIIVRVHEVGLPIPMAVITGVAS